MLQPFVCDLSRQIRDRQEERERGGLADCGRRLQQALALDRQLIDPRSQHRLNRRRYLYRSRLPGQAIRTTLTAQGPRFRERPYTLLEEEGIPARSLGEKLFQRRESSVGSQQRVEHCLRSCRRQRFQSQLTIVRLVGPAMLVL